MIKICFFAINLYNFSVIRVYFSCFSDNERELLRSHWNIQGQFFMHGFQDSLNKKVSVFFCKHSDNLSDEAE
nr:MAG TPA: hypothetical protein [Caudoviricetes sp.]